MAADNVAGQDPRARGRSVVDWRDDLDYPVLLRHLDAKTAKFAARLNLHVAEAFGVHVA